MQEIVLKIYQLFKKSKTLTYEPTEKTENKMKMMRKLNNYNGLQDWKKEHQPVCKYRLKTAQDSV